MEKEKESLDNMYKWKIDILSSEWLKLIDENRSLRDQLTLKKNTSFQIIFEMAYPEKFILREGIPLKLSSAEVVLLSQEIPLALMTILVIMNSLILLMVTYSILALLLIAVIWLVIRKY